MDWNRWEQIGMRSPLVHHITNAVTINDCANMTLACGASPVMAHSPEEAADMTAVSQALVLNIGTLDVRQAEAMMMAGRAAGKRKVPIILDPVGAGATTFRLQAAESLLEAFPIQIIRGNRSEIATLCGRRSGKGVDANSMELEDLLPHFRDLASRLETTVAVSGPVDVVTDGTREAFIHNGTPLLARVTGTGCMATSLAGCGLGAGIAPFEAAVLALTAVGLAGELAESSLTEGEGIGTFRMRFFDAVDRLDPTTLAQGANVKSGFLGTQ